jgi:hypothetical protein
MPDNFDGARVLCQWQGFFKVRFHFVLPLQAEVTVRLFPQVVDRAVMKIKPFGLT